MVKKKRYKILPISIIIVIIIGLGFFTYFGVLQQTGFGFGLEDYTLYGENDVELTPPFVIGNIQSFGEYEDVTQESKYWKVEGNAKIDQALSNDFRAVFVAPPRQTGNSASLTAYSKLNVKDKNFRVNLESQCQDDGHGNGGGQLFLLIGDLSSEQIGIHTIPGTTGSAELIVDGGFEGRAEVYINGRYQGDVDYSDLDEVPLKFQLNCGGVSPNVNANKLILENPRYQLPFDICSLDGNDLYLSYTYESSESISLNLNEDNELVLNNYEQYPLKRFCIGLPAILISSGEGGIRTSVQVYEELIEGNILNVDDLAGSPESVILFGIYDNPNGDLVTCDEGFIRNADTLECESTEPLGIEEPISGVSEDADIVYQSRYEEVNDELIDVNGGLTSGEFYLRPQLPLENSVIVDTNLGTFTFERNEEIQITPYIILRNKGIVWEHTSDWELIIDEDNGFSVDYVNSNIPIKDEPYNIEIQFNNNLGTPINSQVSVTQENLLLTRTVSPELFNQEISTGSTIIEVPMDTNEFGTIQVTTRPSILLEGGTPGATSSSIVKIINYPITEDGVGEITEQIQETTQTEEDKPAEIIELIEEKSFFEKYWWIGLIILVVIIIVLVLIFRKKR